MSAITWVRNTLIFAGIGAGGLIAIHAALKAPPAAATEEKVAAQTPVILNTAKPAVADVANLAKPLSLESPFGRSEVTGRPVFRVPVDLLFELEIRRDYDNAAGRLPPLPAIEAQPRRAEDEVEPAEDGAAPTATDVSEDELADLPAAARDSADSGRKELTAGNLLLHDGLEILRGKKNASSLDEADRKLSAARRHFEAARDQFRQALTFTPEHRGLLTLMQEAKANLYTCNKHGRGR